MKVNFEEPGILKLWHWGEAQAPYGQSGIVWWSEDYAGEKLSLYNIGMRVEGLEFDMENWQTTFDLTEAA